MRWIALFQRFDVFQRYTVKLTRAKLPANAGNFTRGLHVKRLHTQFTCATCSLPVNTGKFTRVYAASTSRRLHANCLPPDVNLQVILNAELMQIWPRLACKNARVYRQKYMQFAGKNTRIACKNTRHMIAKITANARKIHAQSQAKMPAIAPKNTCNCRQSALTPLVNSPAIST